MDDWHMYDEAGDRCFFARFHPTDADPV